MGAAEQEAEREPCFGISYYKSAQKRSTTLFLSAALVLIAAIFTASFLSRSPQNVPKNVAAPKYFEELKQSSPGRTAFHFQPQRNWMNDPNGPMFYNGFYHLFYQYNQHAAIWGNISWGHAVSEDLINWVFLKPALQPDKWYDIQGVWSGSVTMVDGKPVVLYTGILNDAYEEVQNLALPSNLSDPFLQIWKKGDHNPVLRRPKGSKEFRDPSTAWKGKDGSWRMIIGSQINGDGVALLYKSSDFLNWELSDLPLYSVSQTGMWECPDFFPVSLNSKTGLDYTLEHGNSVKYILKLSLFDRTVDTYKIGSYDSNTDTFVPDDSSVEFLVDYGRFYASKSFYDEKKQRRILWGWISESTSIEENIAKGWASIQSIPRQIWFDFGKQMLLQWPIEEVETLRKETAFFISDFKLKQGARFKLESGRGLQLDIEAYFQIPNMDLLEFEEEKTFEDGNNACNKSRGPTFGLLLLASEDLQEYTSIFYRLTKSSSGVRVLLCSDPGRSSLGKDSREKMYGSFLKIGNENMLHLRLLVDHSIVECFAEGGSTVMTSRAYPTIASVQKQANAFVFNNASTAIILVNISVWEMQNSIFMNYNNIVD